MFGIGVFILDLVAPFLESIAPLMPGEIFPFSSSGKCSKERLSHQ